MLSRLYFTDDLCHFPLFVEPKKECFVGTKQEKVTVNDKLRNTICVSDQEVEVTSCSGTCLSTAMVDLIDLDAFGSISNNCKCCKPATTEMREVSFTCKCLGTLSSFKDIYCHFMEFHTQFFKWLSAIIFHGYSVSFSSLFSVGLDCSYPLVW